MPVFTPGLTEEGALTETAVLLPSTTCPPYINLPANNPSCHVCIHDGALVDNHDAEEASVHLALHCT